MRIATLAIATLALASTAAAGSSTATAPAPAAKPACAASLQKTDGGKGYRIMRECAAAVTVGQEPVVDGLGQSEDGGIGPVALSLFSAGLIGVGIFLAADDNNGALPDDDDGGLDPVSP